MSKGSIDISVNEVLVGRNKEIIRVVIEVVHMLVELGVREASDIEGVAQEGALHLLYAIIYLPEDFNNRT